MGTGKITTAIGPSLDSAYNVALQPDGKILVSGLSFTDIGRSVAVVRYNTNGSLDTTFDGDGRAIAAFPEAGDMGYGLAVQPDGKIVVSGSSPFAVVRFTSDGSADTSFGVAGNAFANFGNGVAAGQALALQSDGKIVVVGSVFANGNDDFALARFNADGSLDTTFDGDGRIQTDFGASEQGWSVALQSDGKIVATGRSASGFAVARYNANGSLDSTFGGDGTVLLPLEGGAFARSVVVQPDGKILVGGSAGFYGEDGLGVLRLESDGSLDQDFGENGSTAVTTGDTESAFGMALQPDGKILLSGYASNGTDLDFALVRFDANGAPDTSFGDGGGVLTPISSGGTAGDFGQDVALQPDGRIVVAGYSLRNGSFDFALVRYNADGTLDTTFDGVPLAPPAPRPVTPVSDAVQLSGNPLVDGLLQGSAWQFGDGAHVLKYSLSWNDTGVGGTWRDFGNTGLATAVRQAFTQWSNVANVTFQEAGSGTHFPESAADIAVTLTGNELQLASGAVALSFFPSPSYADQLIATTGYSRIEYPFPEGDIFLDNYAAPYSGTNQGGYGYSIVLREIGLALGLKHSYDGGTNGRPTFATLGIGDMDHPRFTLMGQDPVGDIGSGHVTTPMPLDILAIQHVYGANTTYHTGNDSYALAGYWTIWDAGGTDELTAASASGASTIDLNPGHYSTSVDNTVAIAYNVIIENAVGSAYNDTIVGNSSANKLDGGPGADTLRGGDGDDTYVVDDLSDAVSENAGEGSDTVISRLSITLGDNIENLTLAGAAGIAATGNALANVLTGNAGKNVISGGAGDDVIDGGSGVDTMSGGVGNDTYIVSDSDWSQGPSFLRLEGQPGAYVLNGETRFFTPADGSFTFQPMDLTGDGLVDGLRVHFRTPDPGGFWILTVATSQLGLNLEPGTYTGAERFVASPGHPGLDLAGEGRSASGVSGAFTINAVQFDYGSATPTLLRFSVDFEMHDGAQAAVYGTFSYDYGNFTPVPESVLELPDEGTDTVRSSIDYILPDNVENLVLTGTAAISGTGNAGANVVTGNARDNRLFGGDGNDVLDGGLGVDTMRGERGDDTYVVAQLDPSTAPTVLALHGEANASIVRGDLSYGTSDGTFSFLLTDQTGDGKVDTLRVDYVDHIGYQYGNYYFLEVSTAQLGTNLQLGTYTNTERSPFATPGHPGLTFGGNHIGANEEYGRFTINELDIDYSAGAPVLLHYSVSFEQHAETPTAPAVTGTFNYNYSGSAVTAESVVELPDEGNDTVRSSIDYTLPDNVENLVLTGSAAIGGTGNALANVFTGNSASNILTGGAGNDTLNGGAGFDTAVFSGARSTYTVVKSAADTLVSGPDGVDTLSGIERLQFSDAVLDLTGRTRIDFNSDGMSDVLWRNSDGSLASWYMNGGIQFSGNLLATVSPSWRVVDAHGDYNGDGKSDLLWSASDGSIATWHMNGASFSGNFLGTLPASWTVLDGHADFNGDGMSDLLLRNSDGTVALWQMNGGTFTGQVLGVVPLTWSVIDAHGDYNGDGNNDLLWRSLDGTVATWQMNGGTFSGNVLGVVPASWTVIDAHGDYNGDGKSDLFWRSADGTVATWQMNGGASFSGNVLGVIPTNWTLIDGHADYNADGRSDLLWRNSDGTVATWQMNGGTSSTGNLLGVIPTNWTLIDGHADYNADGKSDLLWRNSDGTVATWQMNGGTSFSGSVLPAVPLIWNVVEAAELGATINGDEAANTLVGTIGRDTLYGAGGNDVLSGGPAADTFVYRAAGDAGGVVTDFSKAEGDILNARELLQTFTGYDGSNAFSGGYIRFVAAGSGTLVQIDADGAANAFVTFATLNNILLQQSDTANYVV